MYEVVAPAAFPSIPLTNNWKAIPYAIHDIAELAIAIHTIEAGILGSTIFFPVTDAAARPIAGSITGMAARPAMITAAATIARRG